MRLLFVRRALLVGNAIVIPTALFLGWALVYGVEPVKYDWVTESTDADGNPIEGRFRVACEPHVLSQAIYSREALAKFAAEAVVDLNNYDYLNWDEKLADATENFLTPQMARVYMAAFKRGKLLDSIRRSYLTVETRLDGQPIVTVEHKTTTKQSWTVQVPVQVFYGTGARTVAGVKTDKNMTQSFVFTVELVAQPPGEKNFRGVAVTSIKSTRISNRSIYEQLRNSQTAGD